MLIVVIVQRIDAAVRRENEIRIIVQCRRGLIVADIDDIIVIPSELIDESSVAREDVQLFRLVREEKKAVL